MLLTVYGWLYITPYIQILRIRSSLDFGIWQDGIQNELITSLTNSEELKVRQLESINSLLQSKGLTNYASITPSVASTFSQKLEADVFIYGSIKQVGTTIRLNALLIDTKTEETFKSFQIDGIAENILHITDSLSMMVKNFLILSKLRSGMSPEVQYHTSISTNSPEAYRCYIYGRNAFRERDYSTALEWDLKALEIDSNFVEAGLSLPYSYSNQDLYEEAKKWCLKLNEKRNQLPVKLKLTAELNYSYYFETPIEEIEYDKQLLKLDDQSPVTYYSLGFDYVRLFQSDKAIPEYEKALEIYDKWGVKPQWVYNYISLGAAYHKTGQYKKKKKLYKKAEKDFPDDPELLVRQFILSLTEGDTIAASRHIEKFISYARENSAPETEISSWLAQIYTEAGVLDKADEYYRKALSLEPENPERMNSLWLMIINAIYVFWIKIILKIISLSPCEVSFNIKLKPFGYEKANVYFPDIYPFNVGCNGNQLYQIY